MWTWKRWCRINIHHQCFDFDHIRKEQGTGRERFVYVSNGSCKGDWCHCKTTWLWKTSSRRSINLQTSENGGQDASEVLRIPKSKCPDVWIRLPRHKWPKSWSGIEDPVVLLERNVCEHPVAGFLWERHFEKFLWGPGWAKVPIENVSLFTTKQGLFLSVSVDEIKMVGGRHKMSPMWKKFVKLVDLEEPTPFLDHVNLGCTQRECE